MQIAYLIGNGFDIALGLKTRYSDFYDYYITVESDSALVNRFKTDLAKGMQEADKWSDFELALGSYLENLSDNKEFDELTGDIRSQLSTYLKSIQNDFSSESNLKESRHIFLEHLFRPEEQLRGRSKENLRQFYSSINKRPIYYNVINFNYTNTIEQILGVTRFSNEYINMNHKVNVGNSERVLNALYHVHGTVFEDMVLGVNDDEQINNLNFRENRDIRSEFIKAECNLAQDHGVELKCINLIKVADIICIFGSSLGKTDQIWWDLVAEQVRNRNCRLVVFDYQQDYSPLISSRRTRFKREVMYKIFGDNQPNDLSDKVLFDINSGLFKWGRS
ncbi:bacteriophage abortive infection AbiH family protein [Rheinheimera marina]|uniref:Bacteriophage abortive infection AbiH family protein n=1 Tax=Rheinheimera marina TaxID=1774958 RepID=A0ABV9JM34_9GAMM